MFVPTDKVYNVRCMATGHTYQTDLKELAAALRTGNPFKDKPYNEVAHGYTRLFFEIDGCIPTNLETAAWVALREFTSWRQKFLFSTAKILFKKGKTILRSSKKGQPRFHVIHPAVILTTSEYVALIKALQTEFDVLDLTANESCAWLRFPKAPKREEKRCYHLVKGDYENAFINPHHAAGRAVKVNTKGIIGSKDEKRIYETFKVKVSKTGYLDQRVRVYFAKPPCRCVNGTLHSKRPVVICVSDTNLWLGKCSDPSCYSLPTPCSPP